MGKTKFEQEEEVSNYTNSEFVVTSAPNHHSRRLKKDALREKKMNKALQKKTAASEEHQTDNLSTKHKSDQDHSITSPDNTHKNPGVTPSIGIDNLSYPLAGLLNKPTYVSINQKNKISGNYGHGTAYFKRPLIQGNYFLEYTVRQDTKKQKKVKYDSAIRVGICEVDFNPAFPLGCKQSVAYKSADGTIIYQNEKIGTAQPYKVGDTIAICLKLGPLQKFRDPKAKSEGSSLQLYKNGKLVFQFKQLKQVFYCLGVSFFNYSQIQILKKEECSYIEGAVQYFKCLKEKIPYKDLQHNNMFKI